MANTKPPVKPPPQQVAPLPADFVPQTHPGSRVKKGGPAEDPNRPSDVEGQGTLLVMAVVLTVLVAGLWVASQPKKGGDFRTTPQGAASQLR